MKTPPFNTHNLIPLAGIVVVISGVYLSLEISLFIALASVATSYFITHRNILITADKDLVRRVELETVPQNSALKRIDLKAHYFHLHAVLKSINANHFAQPYQQNEAFLYHRLSVSTEGLLQINRVKETKPIRYSPQEAKEIATAIYRMAFVCSLYLDKDVTLLIDKGIGHFLMKPFKALHSTPAVLEIGYHFNRLSYFYKRNNSPEYKAIHPLNLENASKIIQGVFRKKWFKKHPPLLEESSPELKRTMQEHRITESPTMHTRFVPLSAEQKRRWLTGVSDDKLKIAQKMLDLLISYKSAAQFSKQLQGVIARFNQFIHYLPVDQRDYILVVPNIGDRKLTSNHWVTALAIPLLAKKPKAVVGHLEIERYKLAHPEIKYCVFIDDAVYSGRQLSDYISKAEGLNLSTVLILPFYTRINRVDHVTHQFLGEIMLKPCEMICSQWTRDDKDRMFGNTSWSPPANKVGTFFFHKLPDDASSFLGIYNNQGQALIEPVKNGLCNY